MLQIPTTPFTKESRKVLLEKLERLKRELERVRGLIEARGESEQKLLAEEALTARILALQDLYRWQTPIVPAARCPFTGLELHLSIDTFGLDGPWWDVEQPVRAGQDFPSTTVALTGAVDLHEPYGAAPHIVRPGPGAPYVLPGLSEQPGIVAVLASLPIGRHQGYVTTYFSHSGEDEHPVVDEWGRHGWDIQRGNSPGWDSHPLTLEDCDFDLAPWLDSEKLLWIEPGDHSLKLHAGKKDCPYLNRKGRRTLQTLFEGRLS